MANDKDNDKIAYLKERIEIHEAHVKRLSDRRDACIWIPVVLVLGGLLYTYHIDHSALQEALPPGNLIALFLATYGILLLASSLSALLILVVRPDYSYKRDLHLTEISRLTNIIIDSE